MSKQIIQKLLVVKQESNLEKEKKHNTHFSVFYSMPSNLFHFVFLSLLNAKDMC